MTDDLSKSLQAVVSPHPAEEKSYVLNVANKLRSHQNFISDQQSMIVFVIPFNRLEVSMLESTCGVTD